VKITFNVETFLKKLSSDDVQAETDLPKIQELAVQVCGTGSIHTASQTCIEAKTSV
jgi:hypothetical protein